MQKQIRIVALALIACMLMTSAAFAETFAHPTQSYTMEYPGTWTLISKKMVDDATMAYIATGKHPSKGNAVYEQYAAQVSAADTTVLVNKGASVKLTILSKALPTELTNELVVTTIVPLLIEQYKATITDLAMTDDGTVVKFGESDFVRCVGHYTMGDSPAVMEQYILLSSTTMYVIICARTDVTAKEELVINPEVEAILASFVAAQ